MPADDPTRTFSLSIRQRTGNLGFTTYLVVEDALPHLRPVRLARILRSAEDVRTILLANMNGEYCEVVTTHGVLPA